MKKALAVLVAVFGLMFMTGCSSVSTAADQVALHYEGGSFSSKKFAGCVPNSKKDYAGPGDTFYTYPANQRFVDATGGDNSDFGAITVVSKDNVEMQIPVTLNFYLRTDCKTLREFHENVGNRFHAYMDGDSTGDGWKNMLRVVVYQPMDTTLDRIAQQYPWRDLYNKPEVKAEIEKALNENIADIVKRQTNNQDFFDNWSALVQKPTPANQALREQVAAEQTNVASAQAAEAKARADKAAAEAQVAVAKAQAASKAAEIKGYGSVDEYNKRQAIEHGLNPYQPTYVVNGTVPPK
jgi:regulator of protease activity HflC (stomatin/prohibitin superfamily)